MRWPVLDGLPDEDRQRVLALTRRRRFARGEVVFHEDDPAETVHLVVSGRFAVTIFSPLGDEAILAIMVPGDAFGELALIGDNPTRSATVVALEPAESWSISRSDFEALRRAAPQVDRFLVGLLATQLRVMNRRFFEVLFVSAEDRVRLRVAELASIYSTGRRPTTIPLTQKQVAAFAGTTRVTANRVVQALAQEGVVELHRGRIVALLP